MSANYVNIEGGTTFNLEVSPQNLSVQNSQIRLVCKTSGGAITINLPPISAFGNSLDAVILVDDTDDMANTNNITIVPDVSNTIANGSSYVISENGGKIEIYMSSTTEFGVLGTSTGGGGVTSVLFFDSKSVFPLVGNTAIMYVSRDNGKEYRWSGVAYVELLGQIYKLFIKRLLITDILVANQLVDVVTDDTSLYQILAIQRISLKTISLPLLTLINENVVVSSCNNLESFVTPLLNSVKDIAISNNSKISLINLSSLVNHNYQMSLSADDLLSEIDLSLLVTANSILISTNPVLSILKLQSLQSANSLAISGCGLTVIDLINLLNTTTSLSISNNPNVNAINVPLLNDSSFEVSFCPSLLSVNLPLLTKRGIYLDSNANLNSINAPNFNLGSFVVSNNPLLPSISLPSFTSVGSILYVLINNSLTTISVPLFNGNDCRINGNNSLTIISLPSFVGVVTSAFYVDSNNVLTSVSAPLYLGAVSITNNPLLGTIDLSSDISGSISIIGNNSLTLVNINSNINGALNITGNALLDTIQMGAYVGDSLLISLNDNALNTVCVDSILLSLDTNGGLNGTLNIAGGTNSIPTGGVANPNLVSLQGKGWTIFTN